MDIVLISRNKTKLINTATEIEKLYNVKTECIQADFSRRTCYSHIQKTLKDMDIGILVNNVGILQFKSQEFDNVDESFVWNEIDINCGAVTMMTKMVLPNMKKKRKGLIVNMSSISSLAGFPTTSLYAATKVFINMFSLNIQCEVEKYNIHVQNLIPYFIETNLLLDGADILQYLKSKAKLFIPDPETYAKSAIYALNTNYLYTTGYWPHSLLTLLQSPIPLWIRAKCLYYVMVHLFKNNKLRNS